MNYENQSEGSKALDQREHNTDASAKRVILRGQNPDDGEWYNVSVVESTDVPGIFGLVILNPDGSSIGTGTTPTTSYRITSTGDRRVTSFGDIRKVS